VTCPGCTRWKDSHAVTPANPNVRFRHTVLGSRATYFDWRFNGPAPERVRSSPRSPERCRTPQEGDLPTCRPRSVLRQHTEPLFAPTLRRCIPRPVPCRVPALRKGRKRFGMSCLSSAPLCTHRATLQCQRPRVPSMRPWLVECTRANPGRQTGSKVAGSAWDSRSCPLKALLDVPPAGSRSS
jgi:hypothetical protein